MQIRLRTHVLLVVLVVSAVISAACTSDGTTTGAGSGASASGTGSSGSDETSGVGDPVELIRSVTRSIEDAGSYRATFDMKFEAAGRSFAVSGEGDFSDDPPQARVTYLYEGLPGFGRDLTMEMILDGSTMYMRTPLLRRSMGITTPWVSMNLDELVPGFSELAALSQGQNDPTASLTYLQGITDAEEVGSEVVAGIETTHYRGSLDMGRAYRNLPADTEAALEQAIAQAKRVFGDEPMPVDVWIDDEGLLRRMSFTLRADGLAKRAFGLEMSIEIPEYGVDVDLSIPPKQDVTDLGRFVDQASGF